MTVACPRHGVIAAPADSPCPSCGVALYDLGDRNARDVVRPNRHTALKLRRLAFGAIVVVGGTVIAVARASNEHMGIDVVTLAVAISVAVFGAAPFARLIEQQKPLRALDLYLQKNRI